LAKVGPHSWYWSRNGQTVESISIHIESPTSLRLAYRVKTHRRAEDMDYAVTVEWTPCHLGGQRPWFLAPCCGRRVALLYSSILFACRHCLSLNYASQQASKRDRPLDRSFALRGALGCEHGPLVIRADLIPKPKGMHWRTFALKVEEIKRVDALVLAGIAAQYGWTITPG
jgi:hypothetical protein